jgi:hypothetical protein
MFDEWRLPTRYAADSTSTIRVTKDQLDSGLNVRIPKQLDKGVTAFLGSETANPPAVAVPLLRAAWHGLRWKWAVIKSSRAIRALKVHGPMFGFIASREIWSMPATGIGRLSGTRPQVISARKGRRLQRFFWGADPSNLTSWVLPPH